MQEDYVMVSSYTIEICAPFVINFNENILGNLSPVYLILCTHITFPSVKIFNDHNSQIS